MSNLGEGVAMRIRIINWAVLVCLIAGTSSGCRRLSSAKRASESAIASHIESKTPEERGSADPAVPVAAGTATPEARRPMYSSYPRGRWRLIPISELERTMLWVSHVLIRHEDSAANETPFPDAPAWEALDAPPKRTREQALELAQRIAKKLQLAPGDFAKLAEEHSEDTETNKHGGSLGGITVGKWGQRWPQAVDALATLKPGQVSDVVETEFGFHVFLRRSPPAPGQVAGRRILIGHERAPYLAIYRQGAEVKRPRTEALALATQIAKQAREAPEHFQELIAKYSEGPDAKHGGDFGVWSVLEPSTQRREIEALQGCRVGEVIGPIDSAFGYQVLLRTPVEPRRKYAAATVKLRFDPSAPAGHESSRAAVRAKAEEMIQSLLKRPDRIVEYQEQYGSTGITEWTHGRGPYEVSEALDHLAMGAITKQPVELEVLFVVARRLDPAAQPPPAATLFELRSPSAPDVLYAAEGAPRKWLAGILDKARERTEHSAKPDGTKQSDCAEAYRSVVDAIGSNQEPDTRLKQFKSAWSDLGKCLGPHAFAGYLAAFNQLYESDVLKTGGT